MHYIYVRQKADKASLICRTEPNKKMAMEKTKTKNEMLRRNGPLIKSVELVLRPEGTVGKICERGRS